MSSLQKSAGQAANPDPQKNTNQGSSNDAPKCWNMLMVFPRSIRRVLFVFSAERRSNMRAATLAGIGAFFATWGAFYYNNRHAPPWIAVSLFCFGGIWMALLAGQVVINFRQSDLRATICFGIVVVAVLWLTGLDLYFEYRPSSSEPKPRAHFSFSVLPSAVGGEMAPPDDVVKLTNDFLELPLFDKEHSVSGCLTIPVQVDQTNVLLRFWVWSPVLAPDTEILISLPKEWSCMADAKWESSYIPFSGETHSNSKRTLKVEVQSWRYRIPFPLLPFDLIELPPIVITRMPKQIAGTLGMGDIAILAQAKDWAPESIAFNSFFFSITPTNLPLRVKPAVALIQKTNGQDALVLSFPPSKSN